MRRVVLIVPELVGDPEAESPLRQNLPAFRRLAEIGEVRRLAPMPPSETPEALFLGARVGEIALRPGPLVVSALGADPPDRSIHFHLSLLSFHDGQASDVSPLPTPEEFRQLMEAAKRLDTRSLTILPGEALDHGLVLEGRGDLGTTPAIKVVGKEIMPLRPEGDHENALRRLIDDSINLLSGHEINLRRMDEGIAPVNLLWPWGHGVRTPVPNLALRRGESAVIESASWRLAGLARLVGDRHADRLAFGRGLQTKLRPLARRTVGERLTIVLIEAPRELRAANLEEELHWFVREMDRELIEPLLDSAPEEGFHLALFAPRRDGDGLAVWANPPKDAGGRFPFDERTLEEMGAIRIDLDFGIRASIAPRGESTA